jgi:hypothetical protein
VLDDARRNAAGSPFVDVVPEGTKFFGKVAHGRQHEMGSLSMPPMAAK